MTHVTHESVGARAIALPPDLLRGIERALDGATANQWIGAAQRLSARYRAPRRDADESALATGRLDALGYAALILPATYAQLRGAIAATAARVPNWQPRTVLDLGSGPGTALWAALHQWPSLERLTAWEREPALIALGRELARESDSPALRAIVWERIDLRERLAATQRYDLIIIGHVLNELNEDARRALIDWAWTHTDGVLLIVEPGTSAAFPLVRAARAYLLTQGARTLAPCAHDAPCPLRDDWCHFPQRLVRPAFQRRARAAPSQWEDSKFSYAAMARFPPDNAIWGRLIREPQSNKAYATVTASTTAGIVRVRGLKRHKTAFRQVRELRWGAPLATPPTGDITIEVVDPVAPTITK